MARNAAKAYHLDYRLLKHLAWEESKWDQDAYNPENSEVGIAQIQLPTWKQFRCEGIPWNPQDSLNCAAKILHARIHACGGEAQGLASYNGGTSRCPTTKHRYVLRILGRVYKARIRAQLYQTIAKTGVLLPQN